MNIKKTQSLPERLEAAIEGWYAKHHHAAVTYGRPVLSSDDKAALHAAVAAVAAEPAKE